MSENEEPNQSSEDGASEEDGDIDMDREEDDNVNVPEPTLAAQTHSPRDDFVQTPPAPETVELPSIVDIDRHSSADGLDASFDGTRDMKLPTRKNSSGLFNGRTAEDDSPLTSADTRETPSPLLLSADNAFARQMTVDSDQSDEEQGEDDGNISDSTASTVPLSRHSDDDENLMSEPETALSQAKLEARKCKNIESMVPPPRASTPTNGKVVSTAYKRRRVMSPSSPIAEDEHSLTSPSERDFPTVPRKRLDRAPSSSLSPVLLSNSLADMFDEEETKTLDRDDQLTPTKNVDRDNGQRASILQPATVDQPVGEQSLKDNSSVPSQMNGITEHMRDAVAQDSDAIAATVKSDGQDKPSVEPATSSQPETQPDQPPVEPAPPPKKRRLDLKKFMTAKIQSPAETTIAPIETPTVIAPSASPLPTAKEMSPVVTKEPSASPFSPGPSAPPPPAIAVPPPPPSVQSPINERSADRSLGASPWWTASSASRPSFTSFENRPNISDILENTRTTSVLGFSIPPAPTDISARNAQPVTSVVTTPEPPLDVAAPPPPPPTLDINMEPPPDATPIKAHSPLATPGGGLDTPRQEGAQTLASPLPWQAKLPLTAIPSHWARIPPALEHKDLPPHVDPESRRVDRFGPLSTASRSPSKITLPLTSPQRLPPAGPRALAPVRPFDMKEVRDPVREVRDIDREKELRDREREREVPRGPRMEYRGRGIAAPRGSPFTPRGGWHGDSYRGRGRGTGEFRGRGYHARGRGAYFNSRGRGV